MDSLAFLEQVKQSRLLSEDQVAEVRRRHSFLLPVHELAGKLQAEGTLTTYQCKQIMAGRAKELVIGQYRILDELGRGGFGQVYKALHSVMNRIVAMKVIAPERVGDDRTREWFRRELLAGAGLHHPNIAMSFDANEENGQIYFVMEFVDGPNLHRFVQTKGPLAVPLACEMLRQTGLALQYAFENGLVHRDIKPANLLIPKPVARREGHGRIAPTLVKVVDFGLARLQTGGFQTLMGNGDKGLMGTPDYMAPEQARDHHHADIRSDIYSLGCTFYYALCGRRPFVGENIAEIVTQHLVAEPDSLASLRPELPAGLVEVVHRMMAKKPEDRFQTPAELIAAVEPLCTTRAAHPESISAPEPEAAEAAEVSAAATRLVAHLAFAQAEPQADAATAAVAVCVAEAEEVDASTADPEVTIAPIAVEPEPEPEVEPTRPVAIPGEVRILWEEWTALVESLTVRRRRLRVKEAVYQELYRSLLGRLRDASGDTTPDERYVYRQMETIVAPWLSLGTFAQTEAVVLQSLWTRCGQLEDRLVPWRSTMGLVRSIAIICVVAIAVVIATQFSQVPGLALDTRWTWTGLRRWVLQNPLPSVAIFSPIVVAVTALLVTRSRRVS